MTTTGTVDLRRGLKPLAILTALAAIAQIGSCVFPGHSPLEHVSALERCWRLIVSALRFGIPVWALIVVGMLALAWRMATSTGSPRLRKLPAPEQYEDASRFPWKFERRNDLSSVNCT